MNISATGLIASLTIGALGQSATAALPQRPNVLFIAIDDLRPELGCYGSTHISSPNIDMLAAKGVLFRRAYCQAPVCGPSRASVMLGVYPRGEKQQSWRAEEMSPDTTTLPEAFRQAGYYTMSNGKIFHDYRDTVARSWSEPPFSLVNGKEIDHLTFFGPDSANFIGGARNRGPFFEAPDVPDDAYIDGMTCDKTIKDMRRLAKANQPFFLACGLIRPHLPFYAPKRYWDKYEAERIPIAHNQERPLNAPATLRGGSEIRSYHDRHLEYNSTAFHTAGRHGYFACVSYADALVGRLLATLDELGLRDNTVVVLWGDHGWNLGEHGFWGKHNLVHNSTRVPLLISSPHCVAGGETDAIVGLVDLYPTLCDLAGINLPPHLEGTNMAPLLSDPKQAGKPAEFTRHDNGHTITTQDFTFTQWSNQQKDRMLFDLRSDPNENSSLAEDSKHAPTVNSLRMQLVAHSASVQERAKALTTSRGREQKAPATNVHTSGRPESAPIAASSSAEKHPATLANDGDKSTFWASDAPPTQSSPQWLRLQYNVPTLVESVEVHGRVKYGPREVELLLSNDGMRFRNVAEEVLDDGQPSLIEFEPTKLRAVELRIKSAYDRGKVGNARNVQVVEVQTNQMSIEKYKRANIRYGEHARHVLDLWQAPSNEPTPLVFVIHGGGWNAGDKDRVHRFVDVAALLKEGISVAAINYRLIKHATADGVVPPVGAPMNDAARALQFIRSKAATWNLDKTRIAAAGGSAGACTCLWLAYHDDQADPQSKDPVARESTRLSCAAVIGPQTTLDPQQMKNWTPNSRYGGHAFGRKNFAEFLADREEILPWIEEYSPFGLVSADDPPVHLSYSLPPAIGETQKDATHTSNFGLKLQERCDEVQIGCELVYPGASSVKHQTPTEYLIASLKQDAEVTHDQLPVLHYDNFENDLAQWVVEQSSGSVVALRQGQLDIEAASGCTVWFKEKLAGPVKIAYEATLVQEGGPFDRVSDMNCFWMAIDPKHPDDLFADRSRRGLFKNYHSLRLYYAGVGGHGNTRTRFRRYPGTGQRPLLPEHDLAEAEYMNVPNKVRRIEIVADGTTIHYIMDGRILFELDDKNPFEEGWFGFRTVRSHIRIDNFRVFGL